MLCRFSNRYAGVVDWKAHDFGQLLPSMSDVAGQSSWIDNPFAMLRTVGEIQCAIMFAALYWPPFIEHDGCVFFAWDFDTNSYDTWIQANSGDKAATEAMLNHYHIVDLFPFSDPSPTLEQVLCVGRAMREAWESKLNREFPERTFQVEFDETPSDDLGDYQITFWQPSNCAQSRPRD